MVKSITRSSIRVMEQDLKKQIGISVRHSRAKGKYTQEQLAEEIGKTPEAISNIERGLSLPTLQTLIDIAKALKVPLSALVGDLAAKVKKAPKRLELDLELQAAADKLDERNLEAAIKIIEVLVETKRR